MDLSDAAFRPGVPGLVPDAWIVTPGAATSAPPVVAVHGITRAVEEMVFHLMPRARSAGRTLILPHFDQAHWPRYQRAACANRADWALIRLMDALRAEGLAGPGRFDLSGFSGGAQFAHRFAWLYPGLVGRLCLTAPGWWTLPDPAIAWPYGIGAAPGAQGPGFCLQSNLRRFLDRQIAVCVGDKDVQRDENLRKGAAIDARQGRHRLARARRWCAEIDACARADGIVPRISLRVMPGCGHSFAECVLKGALDRDFIAKAKRCGTCRSAQGCTGAQAVTKPERKAA
jgi:pimeloyl-ACP methyl ester carboxylesterase